MKIKLNDDKTSHSAKKYLSDSSTKLHLTAKSLKTDEKKVHFCHLLFETSKRQSFLSLCVSSI